MSICFGLRASWRRLYRLNLSATLLLLFACPAAFGATDLNPLPGDPAYRPFSVFSPDAASIEEYLPRVVVVLHGFGSAVPNGTFKRIRKRFLKTHTALGLNYDPTEPIATQEFLQQVAKTHLQGRHITIVGTSLGGFWARYLAKLTAADCVVVINPITNPSIQLARKLARPTINERRNISQTLQQSTLDEYAKFDIDSLIGPRTLLIQTADDDVIDPAIARRKFGSAPGVEHHLYPAGGHTLNLKKHPALERIYRFANP